jgi:hypothetical protein
VRVQNECDRFHQGAFDRIRVECVCDVGLCAQTHMSEFECKPVYVIEGTVVRSIT